MTPINFHKKEKPLTSLVSMGGGAAGMAHAGGVDKTYIDDVFSTYVYKGNDSTINVNNGLDLSTKGGLVWTKSRTTGYNHFLFDTARGTQQTISSSLSNANFFETKGVTSFNTNGFTIGGAGADGGFNSSSTNYTSWSFRKTPGFFDVIKYTGNGVRGRHIAHSLECKPGLILIKNVDSSGQDWCVYHSSESATKYGRLNSTAAWGTATVTRFNDTEPTATQFTLGEDSEVNGNGVEYIAYLFGGAGGAGVSVGAATNQNNGYIRIPSYNVADLTLDGDFTIEIFVKKNGTSYDYMYTIGDANTATGFQLYFSGQNLMFYGGTASGVASAITVKSGVNDNKWHHVVATRSGTTLRFYLDGILENTTTGASVATISGDIVTGENYNTGVTGQGTPSRMATNISNFRITKGQVLYVGQGGSGNGNFGIPTDELTTTSQGAIESNVKLLCFQSTTVTAATKSPVALVHETAQGNVTATTDTTLPFIDPETFIFGEEGDKNIVKCGSYTTDSNEDATLDLGWEPQWLLAKRTDGTSDWMLIDVIRGFPNDSDVQANNTGQCKVLAADSSATENTTARIGIRPNGFYADQYGANRSFVYIAIRRPDGYVGKPAEAGTDVFTTDVGASGSGDPGFDSGFPVDFAFIKQPASIGVWNTSARLMQGRYLQTDNANSQGNDYSGTLFDYMDGYYLSGGISDWNAWMWKRHAGFDVVDYAGISNIRSIQHSMGKPPEMMWIKKRSDTGNWVVYHKGLNGGTNPQNYYIYLDTNGAEGSSSTYFNSTAPTATHFTLGNVSDANTNSQKFMALLFASVDGISKVGSYSGNGSTNLTITTGFQPRFILIKRSDGAGSWHLFDSLRGMGANDKLLQLNSTSAQLDVSYVTPSSTGWTTEGTSLTNGNYIYYAHA